VVQILSVDSETGRKKNVNLVQTGLPIEENNITIHNMTFNDITNSQPICNRSPIPKAQKLLVVASCHEIGSRVYLSSVSYRLSQSPDVVRRNSFWIGQDLGYTLWNCHLVNAKVRIRRNDGPSREINTLSGKVSSESSLLALESLHETTDGFLTQL
jgi:hypothetical protein